jgi:hypothetical protein
VNERAAGQERGTSAWYDAAMEAAVAAAEFTPEAGMILQGHWSTTPSHGVLYPLEARAIVLREEKTILAIVTLDIVGITRESADVIRTSIEQRCGIAARQIMVVASHTHCGPPTLPSLGGKPSAAVMDRISEAAVRCAAEAAQRLEPVTLGLGAASAHINVNRRPLDGARQYSVNYGAINDPRVRVLRIDSASGHPLAVLFHYTCHPTAMRGSDGLISPDYPGVARARIEAALGCRALFLPGCFGNIRPLVLDEQGEFASANPQQLNQLGQVVATAVCGAVASLRTSRASGLWAREMPVEFRFAPPMSADQLQAVRAETTPAAKAVRLPWAQRLLKQIESGARFTSEISRMSAVRIGPLAMITIPGEPVLEIGYAIERRLDGLGSVHDVWPVGYTNDMIGYLCTQRHHREGGYEPNAYPWFDRPAAFEGEEQTIVAAAERLVADPPADTAAPSPAHTHPI